MNASASILAGLGCLLCALASLPTQAALPLTPRDLPGATVVSAAQARELAARGALIVDTRMPGEYVEQHIRGAISVPYRERSAKSVDFDARMDRFDLTWLPGDKDTPVILYCNGGECWKSYKASRTALKAGYTKVYWLRGGIPEWKQKGLPVD